MCAEALLLFCFLARGVDAGLQRLSPALGATEAADNRLLPGASQGKPRVQVAKDKVSSSQCRQRPHESLCCPTFAIEHIRSQLCLYTAFMHAD